MLGIISLIHRIHGALESRASRAPLIILFSFEAVILAYFGYLFFAVPVMGKLGVLQRAIFYGGILSIRFTGCILSMLAVFLRSVRWCRRLFALFLVNACISVVVLEPVVRTECKCHDASPEHGFWQCRVVGQCGAAAHGFVNFFPSPSRIEGVGTPLSDPPNIHEARQEKNSFMEQRHTSLRHAARNTTKRHAPKTNYHSSHSFVGAALRSDGTILEQQKWKRSRHHHHHGGHLNSTNLLDLLKKGALDGVINNFHLSEQFIMWESEDPGHQDTERLCSNITPSDAVLAKPPREMLEALNMYGSANDPQMDPANQFGGNLRLCLADEDCNAISIERVEIERSEFLHVCRMVGNIYPKIEFGAVWEKKFFLQRKSSSEKVLLLFSESFKDLSNEVVFKGLVEVFDDKCVCDSRQGGCQAYLDGNAYKYWCWIDSLTLDDCKRRGVEMYEADEGKFWSTQVCENSYCKCSGFGMPPNPADQLDDSVDLWDNKANYGMRCEAWNGMTSPEKRWCYVGHDSTCADREEVICQHCAHHEGHPKVRMYRSQLACQIHNPSPDLHRAVDSAHFKCRVLFTAALVLYPLLCACACPTSLFMFFFIKNRCGDHIAEKAPQFDVTDDDDDDDTFEATGASEEMKPSDT